MKRKTEKTPVSLEGGRRVEEERSERWLQNDEKQQNERKDSTKEVKR